MNLTPLFVLLLFIISNARCAKILSVFPSPGYSQFILGKRLMIELARRGHEVTVISPFKPKEDIKDYRTILTDGLTDATADDLYQQENISTISSIVSLYNFGELITEYILAHKEVQKLLHSNESFDVVIVEQFVNEAHMGLAPYFNAPLISFHSMGLSEWNSHLIGNIRPPSVNPLSFSPYTDRMSFFQRVHNSLLNWFDVAYKEMVVFPNQQRILSKYFPKEMKLKQVMYNSSIMLLNSHASTNIPSTLTASAIEIGGFHIESKKLPADIQKYLDDATEGAVFFSMGSNLKSSDLPKDKLEGILKAFSKLKQKVLWKFEDTTTPNLPENMFISKWMPQSDILAHPNVKVFITHGGLLSTTEAIHHAVPMIGIPIFGDQKKNVANSVQKGIAVHLPFTGISEKSLTAALNEVLENPKYSKNIQSFSTVLKDQAVNPLDLAMFWIEYVIRHKGAPHLKNAASELYWFQVYLLDVISFLVLLILMSYVIVRSLVKLSFRNKVIDIKKKQKNN